jgi:putative glutamine amidotransferase
MSANLPTPAIGILGKELPVSNESRGCCLWPPGYEAAINAAGGKPIFLNIPAPGKTWAEALDGIEGILFIGDESTNPRVLTEQERLCQYCRKQSMPILAIDYGLHIMNNTFGGNLFVDLAKEQPLALQHRHPPERGLRHAIMVDPSTRLSRIYGEGEIVVNSEHRKAVAKLGKGFKISARALDGITEAIEMESEEWFAVGVQWHPASASASGLDIQLFRGLIEACLQRSAVPVATAAA